MHNLQELEELVAHGKVSSLINLPQAVFPTFRTEYLRMLAMCGEMFDKTLMCLGQLVCIYFQFMKITLHFFINSHAIICLFHVLENVMRLFWSCEGKPWGQESFMLPQSIFACFKPVLLLLRFTC